MATETIIEKSGHPEVVKETKDSASGSNESPEGTVYSANSKPASEVGSESEASYLNGARLYIVTFTLCLALFLSQLEVAVVSTALLSITDEIHDFSRSSWIVTAYLLCYTGFLIPLAKVSDTYGRFPTLMISLTLFVGFSAGCGWSQNMTQLAICRAFQGIGGGGIFELTFAILPDLVPASKYALYTAIVSSTFAFSSSAGPLIGGAIATSTTWRWVFWMNLPFGVVVAVLAWFSMPHNFPYQNRKERHTPSLKNLRRIDMPGSFLILAASVLVVAALETGGTQYNWNTATPLALLCIGLVCWILFVIWQKILAGMKSSAEPALAWRILTNRFAMGVILNSLFVGAAIIAAIIHFPLRFQAVDGQSPLGAGIRLIALMLATPIGNAAGGGLIQIVKMPPFYVLQIGSGLATLGFAVYTGVDAGDLVLLPSQYVLMVVIGVGVGITTASTVLSVPIMFEYRDTAVGMGAIGQFRMLGGAIACSGVANILNRILTEDLTGSVDPNALSDILHDTSAALSLPGVEQELFKESFARAYKWAMTLITILCAMSLLTNMLMMERNPRKAKTGF